MARSPRNRHVQLTLDQARKPDDRHGGWRPGAGRPRKPGAISHDTRPDEPGRFPQHVTLRIAEGVPSLARAGAIKEFRAAVRASHKPARDRAPASHERPDDPHERPDEPAERPAEPSPARVQRGRARATTPGPTNGAFRIVEFNVLGNHLHLVTEADSKRALASGLTAFETRVARRINALVGRRGQLFPHRYHARALKTPREVRNALAYVLLNRKHHAAEQKFTRTWIDPCSSAAWFTGWAQPVPGVDGLSERTFT